MNPKTRVKELLLNPVDYDVKTVAALERKLHISNGTINKWDKVAPSAAYAQAVAEYFGVSVDYLLGNTNEMHPAAVSDKEDPINLAETVDDSERDRMISANGQPISDEDWAIIKAVLAKYPKRD